MREFDLYDRVSKKLQGADKSVLLAASQATGLTTKTLKRLAKAENDARWQTLVAVAKYFRLRP